MFLPNSRYAKVSTVVTSTRDGREVAALKLRPLPSPGAEAHTVKGNDQLDVMSHAAYGDGTRFWHIADANTALQANDLVAQTGNVILKPVA